MFGTGTASDPVPSGSSGITAYRPEMDVINANDDNITCPNLPDLTRHSRLAFGDVINNTVVFCGGEPGFFKQCAKFDTNTNSWIDFATLNTGRVAAAAVSLNDDKIWISGEFFRKSIFQRTTFKNMNSGKYICNFAFE